MNGLTLLALIALTIGIVLAYRAGVLRGSRAGRMASQMPLRPAVTLSPPPPPTDEPRPSPNFERPVASPSPAASAASVAASSVDAPVDERARLLRSLEAETAALRTKLITQDGEIGQLRALAEDRRHVYAELADARAATARYRSLMLDVELNAPPPLLDGPNAPDDLKLIVGVGPVLERMLHQLGITTYRQIARWTERDIDEFDARLPEFPGRIRRDTWVTQARELHHAKFGEPVPTRDRG